MFTSSSSSFLHTYFSLYLSFNNVFKDNSYERCNNPFGLLSCYCMNDNSLLLDPFNTIKFLTRSVEPILSIFLQYHISKRSSYFSFTLPTVHVSARHTAMNQIKTLLVLISHIKLASFVNRLYSIFSRCWSITICTGNGCLEILHKYLRR
jgi:hypothetical protein